MHRRARNIRLEDRSRRLRRRRPFLRGFTLAELVIVTIIIAIMASIAIPRIANSLNRHRIEAAANRVISDIKRARRQARTTSSNQTISFDTATNSYTFVGLPDPDRPNEDYTVHLTDPPFEASLNRASFDGDSLLIFDGYGNPDSGGSVVIDVGGYCATISVDADGGEVTCDIAEIDPEEGTGLGK